MFSFECIEVGAKMSEIFDWKCCYFNQKGGKWLYGHLKLYPRHVRFKPDAGKLAMKSLTINLRNLTAVKRRTTNLFYNALVISERGLHQHWFSSFTDVYDVLNVLEHFWKGILLSPLDGTQCLKSSSTGRNELLEIAYESQSTLMSAATKLYSQGEQIRDTVKKVEMIHADLQVADHIITNLQSWFHSWNVRFNSPVLTRGQSFSVLVAKSKQESHTPSQLILGIKAVDIYDLKKKVMFSFHPNDLGNTLVHSPYDLTFVQRGFGKPDTRAHVISTELPNLLQCVETVYKKELVYEDPPLISDDHKLDDSGDEDDKSDGNNENPAFSDAKSNFDNQLPASHGSGYPWQGMSKGEAVSHRSLMDEPLQQNKKELTDSDANELSGVLQNMKEMALDIQREQDSQNEQLDLLGVSVEKADAKINKESKAIRNMLR